MGTDLLDGWLSAWNNHDAAALAALMTDDGTYEIKATGRVLTRATLEKAVTDRHKLSSDLSLKYLSTQRDGNWYATEWRATGTNDGPVDVLDLPASGRLFTIEGASIGLSEGGKIKRHTEYWDLAAFLSQVGVSPSPKVDWGLARLAYTDNPLDND